MNVSIGLIAFGARYGRRSEPIGADRKRSNRVRVNAVFADISRFDSQVLKKTGQAGTIVHVAGSQNQRSRWGELADEPFNGSPDQGRITLLWEQFTLRIRPGDAVQNDDAEVFDDRCPGSVQKHRVAAEMHFHSNVLPNGQKPRIGPFSDLDMPGRAAF